MLREWKHGIEFELKEEQEGGVRAVIATFNVIDHDGDVTLPGAFPEGAPVSISVYAHNWGILPAGDGRISNTAKQAILEGQFYLGTPQGLQTYQTLKARHERGVVKQQWSYGFHIEEAGEGDFEGSRVRFLKKLSPFEVSPVMLGAGIDTVTLDVKGTGLTLIEHSELVLAASEKYRERLEALKELRTRDDRDLSGATHERAQAVLDSLLASAKALRALLEGSDAEIDDILAAEFLRFQHNSMKERVSG